MATTLLGALADVFANDAFLPAAVPSGLWVGVTPEVAGSTRALPFVVLVHNGQTLDWTFEREYRETDSVSFVVFAEGLAAAEAIATTLKAAFDWATLTITGAVGVQVERTGYKVDADETPAPDAGLVYRVQVDYRCVVSKTY